MWFWRRYIFSFSVLTISFGLGLDLDSNLFGLGLDSDSNLFGLGLVLDSTKVDLTTALVFRFAKLKRFVGLDEKKTFACANVRGLCLSEPYRTVPCRTMQWKSAICGSIHRKLLFFIPARHRVRNSFRIFALSVERKDWFCGPAGSHINMFQFLQTFYKLCKHSY